MCFILFSFFLLFRYSEGLTIIHCSAVHVASELAAFYTKATKSPDQSCSATYLISGEYKFPFSCDADGTNTGSKRKKKENGWSLDLDMDSDSSPYDFTQSQSQSQSRLKPQESVNVEGREKGNGDIIAQTRLTVVGEAGLQGMFAFRHLFSSVA